MSNQVVEVVDQHLKVRDLLAFACPIEVELDQVPKNFENAEDEHLEAEVDEEEPFAFHLLDWL